jgi:Di-haem cytochrome c peroxidase
VLVTIRDPGLLVILRVRGDDLVEEARVDVPADAWGVAVTGDGARAIVSSAWTGRVSLVDLGARRVAWTVGVAREPRGVTIRADGSAAWVTHLVGSALTKIEELDAETPVVRRVELPADPLRSPWGPADRVGASLGYAAALSSDEGRLFVARHALGGLGWVTWFGTATVDVLVTATDEPLAPRRVAPALGAFGSTVNDVADMAIHDDGGVLPNTEPAPFVQPRALVVRRKAGTLLVASEGDDALVELDARAVAPALSTLRKYSLGGPERRIEVGAERRKWGDPPRKELLPPPTCGAPSGVALSADEDVAYVYCRSSDALAVVPLEEHDVGPLPRRWRRNEAYLMARLAESPLPEPAATGRMLFYDASDPVMSGGLACAGCHPDGRDDGFVWREVHRNDSACDGGSCEEPSFMVAHERLAADFDNPRGRKGRPRQTPMLAGRVDAAGPYGWLAESATLEARIREGFALHRWSPSSEPRDAAVARRRRAEPLAAFLREGLVRPPRAAAIEAAAARGREVFTSATTQCARCHDPDHGYTNGLTAALPARPNAIGFAADPKPIFRVPSLFYVGTTAPYFHDGAASTLEELVDENADHMGSTSQLTASERSDLVAFLRSIAPEEAATPPGRDAPVAWSPAKAPVLPPDERGPEREHPRPTSNAALPRYDETPFPETKSKRPSLAEWGAARHVRLARSTAGCDALRIREWLRIECSGAAHLLLLGGSRADLRLMVDPEQPWPPTMMFPVRRGDVRVIEVSEGWKGITAIGVLSVQWPKDEPQPIVALTSVADASN